MVSTHNPTSPLYPFSLLFLWTDMRLPIRGELEIHMSQLGVPKLFLFSKWLPIHGNEMKKKASPVVLTR